MNEAYEAVRSVVPGSGEDGVTITPELPPSHTVDPWQRYRTRGDRRLTPKQTRLAITAALVYLLGLIAGGSCIGYYTIGHRSLIPGLLGGMFGSICRGHTGNRLATGRTRTW